MVGIVLRHRDEAVSTKSSDRILLVIDGHRDVMRLVLTSPKVNGSSNHALSEVDEAEHHRASSRSRCARKVDHR